MAAVLQTEELPAATKFLQGLNPAPVITSVDTCGRFGTRFLLSRGAAFREMPGRCRLGTSMLLKGE